MVKNTLWTVERTPYISKIYERVISKTKDSICIPCLDDILCYGKNDEHFENLRRVLRRLRNFGVKLKAEKYVFFKKEIKKLGKIISENGCRGSTINTEALKKSFEKPQKQLET